MHTLKGNAMLTERERYKKKAGKSTASILGDTVNAQLNNYSHTL